MTFVQWQKFRAVQKCKQSAFPASVCQYISDNQKVIKSKTAIQHGRFVIFDTETTGLEVRKDTVLSIGAVVVQEGKIQFDESLELFISDRNLTKKSAVTIHQIIPRDLQTGIDEKLALIQFLEFIGNGILVGHHVGFDIRMMSKLTLYYFGFQLFNKNLDTFQLAQRLDNHSDRHLLKGHEYTLDALSEAYQIRNSARHNSAGDALATAELFQILLKKAHRRGIQTIGSLLRN